MLVISGLSIYAVSEENDDDPERDDTVPKGIKKINDMGVFSVTATTSVFAYAWMLICLSDQNISVWEAWVTFSFFFVFIAAAFAADKWRESQEKKRKLEEGEELDAKPNTINVDFSAIELYRELMREKQGEKVTNE